MYAMLRITARHSMRENRSTGPRRWRFSVLGVVAVVIGLWLAGSANADDFIGLPDGQETGPNVVLSRTDEHATVSPSLADNGAGRTAMVSGRVTADVTATPVGVNGPNNGPINSPGSNNSSTHGSSQVNTGYIIGCQVNIASNAVSGGLLGGVSLRNGLSGSGFININLTPGQVVFVQLQYTPILKPGRYFVDYQDMEIQVQGCAGYAQARAYSVVEIIGNNYSKTSLYGEPFSLG